MWKFLSALNLVCVMFISGCNNTSSNFKKYELEFSEILKSCFSIASTGNYLRIESVRKQLPSDVVSTGGPFVAYLVNNDIISNVRNFYKENGIQSDEYKGDTYIDKIVNVKITIVKASALNRHDRRAGYIITSFSAEMPNKN